MLNRVGCGNVVWVAVTHCYSLLYCAKYEFTNSFPSLSWDLRLGEFAEMLHSYVLFMTKYAFLIPPLSESQILIAFFVVVSSNSWGSLTHSTLAEIFRCYLLCGLSDLNILFFAWRDSMEPSDFLSFFQSESLSGLRKKIAWMRTLCFNWDAAGSTWLTRTSWWKCSDIFSYFSFQRNSSAWPLPSRTKTTKSMLLWNSTFHWCLSRFPVSNDI